MDLREALRVVMAAGFFIDHVSGAYLKYDPGTEKPWLHQTAWRSSHYFATAEEAIDEFLDNEAVKALRASLGAEPYRFYPKHLVGISQAVRPVKDAYRTMRSA